MEMTKSRYDLKSIIDLDKWNRLQDSLSLVTRMAIITVDYKGAPVTKHSRCQLFCQLVREDPQLASYCQKCDARGGLEAVRINKPYIYKCHFNVVDLAIPIIIDNQYIGALMAGQIRLRASGEEESMLEQIVSRPKLADEQETAGKRDELYAMMPVLPYDEVVHISEMLFNLITYVVQEAIQKHEVIEMYKKAAVGQNPVSQDAANPPELSMQNIQVIRQELSNALVQSHVKQTGVLPFHALNPTLQPAFDYIYTHKHETFNLQSMAQLCHISPSYFSRAFTKEIGDNFSVFIPRLKIEWAKQLLEGTNQPVNQISNDLGFCDAGYFIKMFRKHENVTPAVYRAQYKNRLRE